MNTSDFTAKDRSSEKQQVRGKAQEQAAASGDSHRKTDRILQNKNVRSTFMSPTPNNSLPHRYSQNSAAFLKEEYLHDDIGF